jgi:hypothetical protein
VEAVPNPEGPIFSQPSLMGRLAFFEFAPSNGAGMGSACACTAVTSAKGEALTFTRAGAATCSKQGLATTGIANGDLVVCTANQPRVEPSGGVLGLRVEGARTNSVLRSQELDNAAWADDSAPVAVITVTANAATAPDGTLTAERFQIPARTGLQYSLRRQAIAAGSTGSASIYVKGNGTSGSISLATDGSLATATDCAYVDTTWTRCVLGTIGPWFFVGAATGYGATSGTKAAQDVFVWGAQTEGSGVATYATSYIPTVAAAVTRNVESASFPISLSTAAGFSLAATRADLQPVSTAPSLWGLGPGLYQDISNRSQLYRVFTNVLAVDVISTSGTRGLAGAPTIGPYTDLTPLRQSMSYSGAGASSTVSRFYEGTLIDTSAAGLTSAFTATSLFLNGFTGAAANDNGIISRVCVDPSPSRCR